MSKLAKIIRMEFRLTAANKAFIVLTILGPFLIAAVTVLPTLLTMSGSTNTAETRIALAGADPSYVASVAPVFAASKIVVSASQESTAALDARVTDGSLDGYIVVPADLAGATHLEFVSKAAADFRTLGVLQGVIGQSIVTARLVKAGVAARDVAALTAPPVFDTRQLTSSGEKKSSDFFTVLMTGLVLAMLIYMTTLLYGQAIGRSVLTEKTAKTVEIMLSSVRPLDLLFGKILGKALASLLQYGVWVVISAAVLRLLKPLLGVSVSFSITPTTLAFLVLFFILAFLEYSSLYAGLGAASEDEQHLAQLAWPVIIFLIIPVVMISPIISSPNAPFVVVLSLFPLTSPIVMFLRIVVGAAPPGEILLCVALLLVSIGAVVWLSAKIFRVGILMTGKRFRFTEVLRLARYR
jgi:ABC-2 type transport system permease protein